MLVYYPFGSPMPGRQFNLGSYRYGFNGQEKDDEIAGGGNSYTADFWQYDSRLGRRWNIDPVDQIGISNYAVFRNNPLWFKDPYGAQVEPTTEAAKSDMEKFGEKTRINGNGRVKNNKNYESAFGEMYEKWKNDDNILVKFTTKEGDGSISFEGENEKGQKVYNVHWDPSQNKKLGASGIFEESYHLFEALEGKDLAFDKPYNGTPGLDIYDEVRAKKWVVNNIKSVEKIFKIEGDYYGYTHYGYIQKVGDDEVIKGLLMNGAPWESPIYRAANSGSSFGGKVITEYQPSNFGGGYSRMSPTPKKP